MNCLASVLSAHFKLKRKEFNLHGTLSIFVVVSVILAIVLGFRALIHLVPDSYTAKELFSMGIVLTGLFEVHTHTISNEQIKMTTFFPRLEAKSIRRFFVYKKASFVYFVILYLLFPTEFTKEEFHVFFFFFTCIMIWMFINTLTYKISPDTEWPRRINTFLRMFYFILFMSYIWVDIGNFELIPFAMSLNFWSLAIAGTLLSVINILIIPFPNRKEGRDD